MRNLIDLVEGLIPDIDEQTNKQILDTIWQDIDWRGGDGEQIEQVLATHYGYDAEEGTIEDEKGIVYPRNTPEFKLLYREAFDHYYNERIDDVYWNIENRFKDGKIWLFRVITAPRDWEPEKERHPGIYWSWDRQAADAHWGGTDNNHIKWLLTTQVTSDQINWVVTMAMNANSSYEDEKEIRILDDTKIDFEWEEWRPGNRGW